MLTVKSRRDYECKLDQCGVTSPEGKTMVRVRDVLFESKIHNCHDCQAISSQAPTNTTKPHS